MSEIGFLTLGVLASAIKFLQCYARFLSSFLSLYETLLMICYYNFIDHLIHIQIHNTKNCNFTNKLLGHFDAMLIHVLSTDTFVEGMTLCIRAFLMKVSFQTEYTVRSEYCCENNAL